METASLRPQQDCQDYWSINIGCLSHGKGRKGAGGAGSLVVLPFAGQVVTSWRSAGKASRQIAGRRVSLGGSARSARMGPRGLAGPAQGWRPSPTKVELCT